MFCSPDIRLEQLRKAPLADHSTALATLAQENVLPSLRTLGIECEPRELRFVDARCTLGADVRDFSWAGDGQLSLSAGGKLSEAAMQSPLDCSRHMAVEILKLKGVTMLDLFTRAGIMGTPE